MNPLISFDADASLCYGIGNICPRSSAGQSEGLLSPRSLVQIQPRALILLARKSSLMAIGLVVFLEIVPGQRDAFVTIARAHGARSLTLEAGNCLSFEVFAPVDSETQIILVEKYVDEAALHAHWNSAHMAEYSARVEAMITSRTRYRCLV